MAAISSETGGLLFGAKLAGTTYTRTNVRQEGLKRWPSIGWAAVADSVSTTAIVDVSEFDHSSYGTSEFAGYYINRYGRTGNDKVKRAGKASLTQSTGTLAHDSTTVYSNTTDLNYELEGVHPQVLDDGIATAQKKRYTSSIKLLTRATDTAGNVADMDMQSSGILMWGTTAGSTSNATPIKTTSAADVDNGTQALSISLSGANGYVRSAKFRVNPNESFYTCLFGRADVGTLTFKVYDETNAAYIDTSRDVAYSGEQFAMLQRRDIAPSGCEEVSIELRGTGASDVLTVGPISGPWPRSTRRIELPQSVNEQYKVRFLKPASYMPITGTANLYDAESRNFIGDYQQPQDFFIENFHREIAAYHLQIVSDGLADELLLRPLWLSLERSRSLDEPLTTETGTTTEDDLEDLLNYVFYEWASALSELKPEDKKWAELKKEYELKTGVTVLAHPPPPQTKPRGMTIVRI